MSKDEEFSKLASIKECPICNKRLEKGYLRVPRGAFWDAEKRILSPGETLVSIWSWTYPTASGLRCDDCEIVIFHYGKRK